MNWTEGLGMAHVPPEYVYDADFTPASLARYKLLLMPLSSEVLPAPSTRQAYTYCVPFVPVGTVYAKVLKHG